MAARLVKACLDVGLVTTKDAEADAVRFYEGVLGFVHDFDVPFPGMGIVKRYNCGDSVFRLFVLEKPAAHANSTDGLASQTGLRYITLTVSNLDELVGDAEQAGFPVISAPRLLRPGMRNAVIEDGMGVTVELMQPVD